MTRLKTTLGLALFIFAIGVAVFSCSKRSPVTTPVALATPTPVKLTTPTEGKPLTLYDNGGRFGCGITLKSEYSDCQNSLVRARRFLWEHWQQKRRGYAVVRFGSTDAVSDSHIFIEPDENGAWRVAWRIERVVSINKSGDIDVVPDIRELEWAVATEKSFNPYTKPGTSILIFKDRDGKEIEKL
jgi:hypothetical protein